MPNLVVCLTEVISGHIRSEVMSVRKIIQ